MNSENFHYVLINDFNRFIANNTKNYGKNIFVDITFISFLAREYKNFM